MNLQILGSGGFLTIPRAACDCRICVKARQKGWPYSRRGPAIFLKDLNILIDTPEDINDSLNFAKAKEVDAILYTHWHPDHTLGYRILETLCDQDFFTKKNRKKIKVYIPEYDWDNFRKFLPGLWHFERLGYANIKKIASRGLMVKGIQIKPVKLNNTSFTSYFIASHNKKILLSPDHSINLPLRQEFHGLNLLVMNMGFFEANLRGAKKLPTNHITRKSTGFIKDNLRIIKALNPQKTVLMHIEEKYNRSNAELTTLEKKYKEMNIKFAIDGMTIEI